MSFNIYRNPTETDIIVPRDSCHLPEQKLAAIKYLVPRLSTCPINKINKKIEHDTIKRTIRNNKYNVNILSRINRINDIKTNKQTTTKNGTSLYMLDKKTKLITELLKNSYLKISFKTDNTIGKLLTHNKKPPI
jgi:hypothetical protein